MKNKHIDTLFRFDYGIETIDTGQRPQSSKLPDGHPTLIPGQENLEARVDQYWTPQSLEHFLFSFVTPSISYSGLLVPRLFRRILKEIKRKIQARTQNKDSKPGDVWHRALQVLEEEESLMELVFMYYNSLHKA